MTPNFNRRPVQVINATGGGTVVFGVGRLRAFLWGVGGGAFASVLSRLLGF
jgi:hypothetical protein